MEGITEYLITSLPSLEEPGSTPPMSMRGFLRHVEPSPKAAEITRAIFLLNDLRQFSSLESSEIEDPDPVVLTIDQMIGEQPLPDFIKPAEKNPPYKIPTDALIAGYYLYLDDLAEKHRSEFLKKWVGWQVALRNELAEARAKVLNLEVTEFLVEPQLAGFYDLGQVVAEWTAAQDPLAGMKVLGTANWNWLKQNDQWFSFSIDELAAYAVKIMVLNRWFRITEAQLEGAK